MSFKHDIMLPRETVRLLSEEGTPERLMLYRGQRWRLKLRLFWKKLRERISEMREELRNN
jgi:hypothetical protein